MLIEDLLYDKDPKEFGCSLGSHLIVKQGHCVGHLLQLNGHFLGTGVNVQGQLIGQCGDVILQTAGDTGTGTAYIAADLTAGKGRGCDGTACKTRIEKAINFTSFNSETK